MSGKGRVGQLKGRMRAAVLMSEVIPEATAR
jgi:hypothetical protein